MKKCIVAVAAVICLIGAMAKPALAAQFKIAIMQDQQGAASKFKPMLDYLGKKGVDASFVATRDYPAAAQMFASGQVDAMFSGSGIAGCMIIKDLATPEIRPVGKDGLSTYWAVVVAPKGAAQFSGKSDYFNGRKVIFSGLASSGEFFFHSLPGSATSTATVMKAASHGAAIDTLDKGQADFAIVKNRVWDRIKNKYPHLVKVGEDTAENPDGTLIVSKKADPKIVSKVTAALMAVRDDTSADAKALKDSLDIQEYVKTTEKDFDHTLTLLKNAGVTRAFNFAY